MSPDFDPRDLRKLPDRRKQPRRIEEVREHYTIQALIAAAIAVTNEDLEPRHSTDEALNQAVDEYLAATMWRYA